MTTPRTQQIFPLVAFFLFTACSSPSNGNDTPNADSRANEATSTNVSTVQGRVLDFEDFTEVSVESGMRVDIQQDEGFHVDVTGSDEALEKLKIEQEGDRLRFFFDNRDQFWRRGDHDVDIMIRMPALEGLDLSSGATGDIAFETPTEEFEADLSSGSRLEGSISARTMEFDLSSGSAVTLAGETGALSVDGSSGSTFDLSGLTAAEVSADLSSGSTARVRTDGVINADLSSGGTVTYEGNPRMGDIETSSGGTVRRAD